MHVERLPDLNIPRTAHVLAFVNGELTVIGGHTTGFIPTATAEYYRNGKWHLVDSYFPHDFGFGVVLPSEEVVVGCGCAEAFGEGLTMGVELYHPASHSFSPLPIVDQRRVRASAALLSNGTIVLSGNWYYGDYISTYSPESGGATIRRAVWQRVNPLIMQTSSDNALILSSIDTSGAKTAAVAERLHGEPLQVPLLEEWEGFFRLDGQLMSQFFIGDETVGGYAWLFPATRKADGQLGLIKVVGEEFSVLETDPPLTVDLPEGETLIREAFLLADKINKCAWVIRPVADAGRMYVFKVDYGQALRGGKAPVTVFQADLPEGVSAPMEMCAVLLPGGRIAVAGGRIMDNYYPLATAYILHTEPVSKEKSRAWLWLIVALAAGGAVLGFVRYLKRSPVKPGMTEGQSEMTERQPEVKTDLMSRIYSLMEDQQIFRKKDLTKADLAEKLGTNATYVTATVNSQTGKSFTELVTDYRILYAQELMREHPDMRLLEVAEESGFASEKSFFRTFKTRLGMTPGEWKASLRDE
jgi:AraC-like DNA-binding protein